MENAIYTTLDIIDCLVKAGFVGAAAVSLVIVAKAVAYYLRHRG